MDEIDWDRTIDDNEYVQVTILNLQKEIDRLKAKLKDTQNMVKKEWGKLRMRDKELEQVKKELEEVKKWKDTFEIQRNGFKVLYDKSQDDFFELNNGHVDLQNELEQVKKELDIQKAKLEGVRITKHLKDKLIAELEKERDQYKLMWEEVRSDMEAYSEDEWPGQTREWLDDVEQKYLKSRVKEPRFVKKDGVLYIEDENGLDKVEGSPTEYAQKKYLKNEPTDKVCPDCDGEGKHQMGGVMTMMTCQKCKGKGEIPKEVK